MHGITKTTTSGWLSYTYRCVPCLTSCCLNLDSRQQLRGFSGTTSGWISNNLSLCTLSCNCCLNLISTQLVHGFSETTNGWLSNNYRCVPCLITAVLGLFQDSWGTVSQKLQVVGLVILIAVYTCLITAVLI